MGTLRLAIPPPFAPALVTLVPLAVTFLLYRNGWPAGEEGRLRAASQVRFLTYLFIVGLILGTVRVLNGR